MVMTRLPTSCGRLVSRTFTRTISALSQRQRIYLWSSTRLIRAMNSIGSAAIMQTQLTSAGIKLNLTWLEDAYFRSRAISAGQYRAVVRLLEIFAEHLSLIINQIALHECNRDSRIVRRAKDYIADHKFDAIKLEQIARALNVSKFHFCRRFKLE